MTSVPLPRPPRRLRAVALHPWWRAARWRPIWFSVGRRDGAEGRLNCYALDSGTGWPHRPPVSWNAPSVPAAIVNLYPCQCRLCRCSAHLAGIWSALAGRGYKSSGRVAACIDAVVVGMSRETPGAMRPVRPHPSRDRASAGFRSCARRGRASHIGATRRVRAPRRPAARRIAAPESL